MKEGVSGSLKDKPKNYPKKKIKILLKSCVTRFTKSIEWIFIK